MACPHAGSWGAARLLDFTWSPYVAAFFALHNTTTEGVIWACNPVEIEKKQVDLEKPASFRKYFLSGAGQFVWLGEPHAMNRRLIAQSGTFLVPAILDKSIEEIMKEYPKPKDTLIKFILPADKIREKSGPSREFFMTPSCAHSASNPREAAT